MAEKSATTAYLCPSGHLRTDSPGHCPEHGVDLRLATHRCPTCGHAAMQGCYYPFCYRALQAA